VIPRAVDEYLGNLDKLRSQPMDDAPANPAWHINAGLTPEDPGSPVSFAMLLNLASTVGAEHVGDLEPYLRRYFENGQIDGEKWASTVLGAMEAHPGSPIPDHHDNLIRPDMTIFDRLLRHAVIYYHDFIKPNKSFRAPDARERRALAELAAALARLPVGAAAEAIQNEVFAVGKRHGFTALRDWFGCLYQVLLGQPDGPRFGGFVALYGISETIVLIEAALSRPADAA
jgi:lysyl-tRNA synthetase class 1